MHATRIQKLLSYITTIMHNTDDAIIAYDFRDYIIDFTNQQLQNTT